MKRISLLLFALLAFVTMGWADGGTTVNLNGMAFTVDTTEYYQISPGTVRFTLRMQSSARAVVAYCLQTDLDNPYNTLRAVKGQDRVNGLETVESMLKRSNARVKDKEYVCGVNADYFYMSTSFPVSAGNTIVDGEPYSMHINPEYSTCSMDADGAFYLGTMRQNISIKGPGITSTTIGYLNEPFDDLAVADGQTRPVAIALFTNRCGSRTRTATDGSVTEIVLRLPEGEHLEAGRSKAIIGTVEGKPTTAGNSVIPEGCVVLATREPSFATKIANLTEGATITITPSFLMDAISRPAYEFALGGLPMILKNGKKYKASDYSFDINFATELGPRTMIGYGDGKRKITIVAIDGRQAYSVGMTADEAADLMLFLGCHTAMNFDGGGSTTMYDKNFGLINRPSAGTQRTVADGLFVCSTAPKDNVIASIAFIDHRPTVCQGRKYTPRIVGYNQYGSVVNANLTGFALTADASLGSINGQTVTATGELGTYQLTATYNGCTATQTLRVLDPNEEDTALDVETGDAVRNHYAYQLSSTLTNDTYTFTYYLTGKSGVLLRLYNATDTVTYDLGQQTTGRHTTTLQRDQIPEGECRWAIVVVTEEGTAAKPFYTGLAKSPRGVAININPESPHFQEMYSFDPFTSGSMGMFVTKPNLTAANTKGYGAGLFATTGERHPVRGTINYNNDRVYWSSWNDEDGGVYMVDPGKLSPVFTNFFAGTIAADGRTTYNGKIVGGSTSGVSIVGTGKNTTLWAFEEDVPSAARPGGNNLCRYDIGTLSGQWTKAPSAIYDAPSALMPNTNVNVVATPRGIFLSQWRGAGNNSIDAPSFIVCSPEGEILFNSYALQQTLQGSLIGGLAVSEDCSRMAIANANGNINLYAITWDADGKPSFRYRYAITNSYGNVYALQFDYAGNLFAATRNGLIGFTVPYFGNTISTPAAATYTVTGTRPTGIKPSTAPDADATLYNLQGIPVKGTPKPGIYIRNGKKVIVK